MSDFGKIKCDACGKEVSKDDLPEVRYGGGGAVPANDVPIYRMSIRPITRPEHGVGGAHFDLCRKCVQRRTNGLEREPGDNLPPPPEPPFPGSAGGTTGRTSSLPPNISNEPKTKPLRQRLVDRVKDRIAKWTFPGV